MSGKTRGPQSRPLSRSQRGGGIAISDNAFLLGVNCNTRLRVPTAMEATCRLLARRARNKIRPTLPITHEVVTTPMSRKTNRRDTSMYSVSRRRSRCSLGSTCEQRPFRLGVCSMLRFPLTHALRAIVLCSTQDNS